MKNFKQNWTSSHKKFENNFNKFQILLYINSTR